MDSSKKTPGQNHSNSNKASGTVLVLNDEFHLRILLRTLIEAEGLGVVATDDIYEGLEKVLENPEIQLVVMNASMAGDAGMEFLSRMKELPSQKRVPVIAVTDANSELVEGNFAQYGVIATLRQPFKSYFLTDAVSAIVRSRMRRITQDEKDSGNDSRKHRDSDRLTIQ